MLYLRDIEVDVHVRCRSCGHEGVLPRADMHRRFGPNYPVLSIAPHYRCSRCDSRDTESRPAPPPLSLIGGTEVDTPDAPPSFAGPLAALQGLLDAVRGRGDADDARPAFQEPAFRDSSANGPANEDRIAVPLRDERESEPERPRPRPLRLDELIADGPGTPEAGRRPLWEPISLADMAGHSDEEPEDEEPAGEDADDGLSPFERTIAALRTMVDADDAMTEAKPAARPFLEADPPERDESEDDDDRPAAFSVNSLVRTDFDDDEDPEEDEQNDDSFLNDIDFGNFRDRHFGDGRTNREMAPDGSADDENADDGADGEPSDDEIVAFAIRDPDKAPPRRERPAAEEQPLDKTIAALRDMVREAAADPDDPDDDPVVTRFVRPRKPVSTPDPELDVESAWDRPIHNRSVPDPETEPDDEPDALTLTDEIAADQPVEDDGQEDDGQSEDDAPRLRKSAQELEMEEALRALRALVEQEDDEDGDQRDGRRAYDGWQDDDDPEEPAPAPARPGRPVSTVPLDEDDGLPTMRKLTGAVPPSPAPKPTWDMDQGLDQDGDKDPDDEDEPFNLVGKLVREAERSGATVSVEPKAAGPGTPDPQPPAAKAAKGESSSLDKTIAALRSMLELDGKRGR